jgi:hypothetical protein
MEPAIRPLEGRAAKEVVHLSYMRVGLGEEAKQWRPLEIAEPINRALEIFQGRVRSDLLGPEWRRPWH